MGSDFDKNTTLGEMAKLPGISDLKSNVKVKFIKALRAEQDNNAADAEKFLAEAVAADESNIANAS